MKLDENQKQEIKRAITLLHPNNELFEIRLIGGKGTASGYFKSAETAVKALESFQPSRYMGKFNTYLVLNQINGACYSRSQRDTIIEKPEKTTEDKDIERYRWLMIDLDPERTKGVSSSEDELQAAFAKAKAIKAYLASEGWKEPVSAVSGNGAHLLYRFDVPNTPENKNRFEGALKALHARFSDEAVAVDTTTYNPARITKLYGTFARKGADSPERPHRLSRIIESTPDVVEINDISLLDNLIRVNLPEEQEAITPKASPVSASGRKFSVADFIQRHNIPVKCTESYKGGTKYVLQHCLFDESHKGKDAAIFEASDGTLGYKCMHNSCADKSWRDVRLRFEPEAYDFKEYKYSELPVTNNKSEEWELPEPFEKSVSLSPFPVSSLPPVLGGFLKAVSESVQVVPEMVALPLLSVLSLCVQSKSVIQYPGGSHTESLNLYSLTVAQPGERKSGVFHALTSPVFRYQHEENQRRKGRIADYKAERQCLENQLASASKGNNANPQRAKEISRQLSELKPVFPLLLNVTDVTPEALAWELYKNNEKMAVINDEGGIFEILSGLYSGGGSNIDLILKAYDGSPYTVVRRTKENIQLESPLLTIGLMAQPSAFSKVMSNPEFIGRGFIQRFLFSFPESRAGCRSFSSPDIPDNVQREYNDLVTRLLSMNSAEAVPVIRSGKGAYSVFCDYFAYIEGRMKQGGQFEYMREWANKQFARCLKIAGILHLCTCNPQEELSELTAQQAVYISLWAENEAMKAFGGGVSEEENDNIIRYIVSRLKAYKAEKISLRDLKRSCPKYKNLDNFEEYVYQLCEMNYLREDESQYSGKGRKPSIIFSINPFLR